VVGVDWQDKRQTTSGNNSLDGVSEIEDGAMIDKVTNKERKGQSITLQCHYCGNEDNKLPMDLKTEEMETMAIKCKCGKWLVKDGIMGHKHNAVE
jgi:hypothetical protein